jgi:hypothetical protein
VNATAVKPKLAVKQAIQATGPQMGIGELFLLFFYILFIFKTIFKMDFETKSKEIKTTLHNNTNATT